MTQIRSQAMSSTTIHASQGQAQADGETDDPENRAKERGGRVLLRDQVHEDQGPRARNLEAVRQDSGPW